LALVTHGKAQAQHTPCGAGCARGDARPAAPPAKR
jgi:hypothetical protein